jgi:hypothetical protein
VRPIRLRPARGEPVPAQAEVVTTAEGVRFARSAGIAVLAAVIGLALVVIPPHGVWSLAGWAAGGVAAWALWSRGAFVARIEGRCPACNAALTLTDVGAAGDDLWVRCPGCQAPYRVDLSG